MPENVKRWLRMQGLDIAHKIIVASASAPEFVRLGMKPSEVDAAIMEIAAAHLNVTLLKPVASAA